MSSLDFICVFSVLITSQFLPIKMEGILKYDLVKVYFKISSLKSCFGLVFFNIYQC